MGIRHSWLLDAEDRAGFTLRVDGVLSHGHEDSRTYHSYDALVNDMADLRRSTVEHRKIYLLTHSVVSLVYLSSGGFLTRLNERFIHPRPVAWPLQYDSDNAEWLLTFVSQVRSSRSMIWVMDAAELNSPNCTQERKAVLRFLHNLRINLVLAVKISPDVYHLLCGFIFKGKIVVSPDHYPLQDIPTPDVTTIVDLPMDRDPFDRPFELE
jgi:hypothetical protein